MADYWRSLEYYVSLLVYIRKVGARAATCGANLKKTKHAR
jgi:hypothetical protein